MPPEASASYDPAEGREWNHWAPLNSCPISEEPTSLPCDLDHGAVGLVVEGDLTDAGHQQWVAEPEYHGEGEQEGQSGEGLAQHVHEVT